MCNFDRIFRHNNNNLHLNKADPDSAMKGLEQIKDEINLLVQDIKALDKDSKIEAMQHLRESVKLLDLGNEEADQKEDKQLKSLIMTGF